MGRDQHSLRISFVWSLVQKNTATTGINTVVFIGALDITASTCIIAIPGVPCIPVAVNWVSCRNLDDDAHFR